MSIEVELHNKGGQVCKQAKAGEIHCPLIVRPTSEDVVTGNVFGMLRYVRPHLWLNPMLNHALDTDEFRQVWFKDFSLRLWERQARFPPELLDFREGQTEPDVVIEWENPPTTVWIEAKWLSGFAKRTNGSGDNDQISRNIRTLLHETGHVETSRLFQVPVRRAIMVLLHLNASQLVALDTQISDEDRTVCSGQATLGHITWSTLRDEALSGREHATVVEANMLGQIEAYLDRKLMSESL